MRGECFAAVGGGWGAVCGGGMLFVVVVVVVEFEGFEAEEGEGGAEAD